MTSSRSFKKKTFQRRKPTETTIKKAQKFLPGLLKFMEGCVQTQPQEILTAWDRLSTVDRLY